MSSMRFPGKIPYPGLNSSEIRRILKEGQHLDKPEFADDVWVGYGP